MRIVHQGINSRTYRTGGSTYSQKSVFATRHYSPVTVKRSRATITQARDSIVLLPPPPTQTRRIMSSNGGGAYQNQKRFFSTRYYNPIYRRTLRYYR
jgi:hypothetical protein